MRILIAGCGDTGSVLASELLQDGHEVHGLKRDISTLPDGVQAVQADLTDPATLQNLPRGIDRLVFMPTPASRDEASYRDIFINGWKNLWSSLHQAPGLTILVSSTAVLGQSDGSIVNEETVPEPGGFNGQVLWELEQLVSGHAENTLVVRFAGIYGPGREHLIKLAGSPGLEIQQSPPYFTNRIHRDDAAAVLRHMLLMDEPDSLYLASDGQPASSYEVVSWLAQAMGYPAPHGLVVESARSGKRVDSQKLFETGFRPRYPNYQAGYREVLAQRNEDEITN